jgi:hypothetical protein
VLQNDTMLLIMTICKLFNRDVSLSDIARAYELSAEELENAQEKAAFWPHYAATPKRLRRPKGEKRNFK